LEEEELLLDDSEDIFADSSCCNWSRTRGFVFGRWILGRWNGGIDDR